MKDSIYCEKQKSLMIKNFSQPLLSAKGPQCRTLRLIPRLCNVCGGTCGRTTTLLERSPGLKVRCAKNTKDRFSCLGWFFLYFFFFFQ